MKLGVRPVAILVFVLAVSSVARAEEPFDVPPASSFNALQQLLTSGEHLIVRDSSGQTTKGRFVSLSGGELEIVRRRWNFRTEPPMWREDAIPLLHHYD